MHGTLNNKEIRLKLKNEKRGESHLGGEISVAFLHKNSAGIDGSQVEGQA